MKDKGTFKCLWSCCSGLMGFRGAPMGEALWQHSGCRCCPQRLALCPRDFVSLPAPLVPAVRLLPVAPVDAHIILEIPWRLCGVVGMPVAVSQCPCLEIGQASPAKCLVLQLLPNHPQLQPREGEKHVEVGIKYGINV